ncbi:hypothetical protein [Streptomyces sp. NPDC047108]|uniref:hypothetical protein n=1 Tax=Streptomyces sp. NPDC047108 TaxID=3155025 RepID=UPI0033E0D5C4
MTPGFPPSSATSFSSTNGSHAQLGRMLQPSEWADAGIPLLRSPREIVTGLHSRHQPMPSTAVVAVLDTDERVAASASFARAGSAADGWVFRNALLTQLRRIIPHDLRRRVPVRTAMLLYCREGDGQWTEEDGAWMWGLRDACTLHGLRCGAYVTLTRDGWQVFGEERGGRRPHAFSKPVDDRKPAERWETAPVTGPRSVDGAPSTHSPRSRNSGHSPKGDDPEVPRRAAAR